MNEELIKTKIILSKSYDPWYNLALEECLLDRVKENEIILYLWQNDNTVVIGRNQNPWKECKCKLLESNDGKLARRLSGGGAVYHDLGNLNFTFIMDKNLYDLKKQLKVIIDAVNSMGIKAEFMGRNDIVVDNKKISGNAFYYREKTAYHHGTLLINSDIEKLVNFLDVSIEKLVSKGINSVKSRVVNLKEIKPEITINLAKESIKDAFINEYSGSGEEIQVNLEEINKYYEKYASWDWRYGNSPKFDIILSNKFNWGYFELGMSLKNGHIDNVKIYSDSLVPDLLETISNNLIDVELSTHKIGNIILSIEPKDKNEEEIKNDIYNWILDQYI